MQVAFSSVFLGISKYLVPFLFVLNPALIFEGSAWTVAGAITTAFIGIFFIGYALEGYLPFVGDFRESRWNWLGRLMMGAGGLAFAIPGGGEHIPYGPVELLVFGSILVAAAATLIRMTRRQTGLVGT